MHYYFTMVTVLSNSPEKENSFLRVGSQVDTFTQHSILPAAHKKVHSEHQSTFVAHIRVSLRVS